MWGEIRRRPMGAAAVPGVTDEPPRRLWDGGDSGA